LKGAQLDNLTHCKTSAAAKQMNSAGDALERHYNETWFYICMF
jgi:hypothetical protein